MPPQRAVAFLCNGIPIDSIPNQNRIGRPRAARNTTVWFGFLHGLCAAIHVCAYLIRRISIRIDDGEHTTTCRVSQTVLLDVHYAIVF